MVMKAAVMHRVAADPAGELVAIEDLGRPRPEAPHDVVVRVAGAGVCRTELHILAGEIPVALPHVLGHENAGFVEAVGSEVTLPDSTVVGSAWRATSPTQ